MPKKPLSKQVKVRVPAQWRTELERRARAEHLDISDIVRRAIDRYLTAEDKLAAAQ